MWNNTKGEQDNLCLALINPRLCKKLSIKVAVEQHDTKTAVPYLHVFLDNTWNLKNCAFIRLDKPEYVPEKNSKRLSTKQKEELIGLHQLLIKVILKRRQDMKPLFRHG